jgi:hypothetical protein
MVAMYSSRVDEIDWKEAAIFQGFEETYIRGESTKAMEKVSDRSAKMNKDRAADAGISKENRNGERHTMQIRANTEIERKNMHGPSTTQYRFRWVSCPIGMSCSLSLLLGSLGSGGTSWASFFLCLLC